MLQSLKVALRKNQVIYAFSKKVFVGITASVRYLRHRIEGTRVNQTFWASYDWGRLGEIDNLVRSPQPHRHFLLDIISHYQPRRVLEIGCGACENLYLIAQTFPLIQVTGVDINPQAIEAGKQFLSQAGIKNVELFLLTMEELNFFSDKSFDLVFTDAVLIYVGPDKIRDVVREMVRLSGKVILIKEYHLFDRPDPLGVYCDGKWIRNYVTLLQQAATEKAQYRVTRFPPDLWPDKRWTEYGAVTECILPE